LKEVVRGLEAFVKENWDFIERKGYIWKREIVRFVK